MTTSVSPLSIRPIQYRDLDNLETWAAKSLAPTVNSTPGLNLLQQVQQFRRWYGLYKFLSWFPNPLRYHFCGYVAESTEQQGLQGFIQIAPFNLSRSTWQVERVIVPEAELDDAFLDRKEIGSQLLRHSFEWVWEARTWVLEVNIQSQDTLALYRQNGFQPLAQLTYWSLNTEILAEIAQNDSELPNLLPVSKADAQLLYQLDCMSMPPLLRQVFDRHVDDFKHPFWVGLWDRFQAWCFKSQIISGYVFEPQRKAAIGYFKLFLSKDGSRPHQAELTVHPAYTWLYPQLLTQMAQITQTVPAQALELLSADYQHEREEYLEKLTAQRVSHTLLMSRSVWHKVKETQPEGLQLSEMLQGLQVPSPPIPSRISWSPQAVSDLAKGATRQAKNKIAAFKQEEAIADNFPKGSSEEGS
jgi:hypothetical protein